MSLLLFTVSVIIGLLLAEARLSRRNESVLRSRGALTPPGDVYRAMAVVYPLAFVGMGVEGIWRASAGTWGTGLGFYAAGLLLFVVSKALKYWAITALQDRWTFKVLVLPAEPLVTTGPYRYVAHPNYVAVVGELAGTAMMMEAWYTGVAALAAFGLLLWQRISFETNALGEAYQKTKR